MKKSKTQPGHIETKTLNGRQIKGVFNGDELVREVKSLPFFVTEVNEDNRTVTGIFSVFGNLDEIYDRVHPGAFSKTITEGRKRFKFLWQHDFTLPPIAAIKSVREVSRAELPSEVLTYAPDATGGAEVTRTYFDTDFANWIYQGIKSGAIDEMSFGYDTIKSKFDEDKSIDGGGMPVRELLELRLWDISDVIHGCNPATVAAKSLEETAENWEQFLEAIKAEDITPENLERFKGLYTTLKGHFETETAEPPPAESQVPSHSLIDELDIALLELESY